MNASNQRGCSDISIDDQISSDTYYSKSSPAYLFWKMIRSKNKDQFKRIRISEDMNRNTEICNMYCLLVKITSISLMIMIGCVQQRYDRDDYHSILLRFFSIFFRFLLTLFVIPCASKDKCDPSVSCKWHFFETCLELNRLFLMWILSTANVFQEV
jgi:hypothetical protein